MSNFCLCCYCADGTQANHCVGAVMFLIENETKAVLYTGDIRCKLHSRHDGIVYSIIKTCNLAEPWWINSLVRNPVILPYTHGLKRLDKIYLDTTFASKTAHCRRFPTKADGLKELLEKVSKYPTDTVFHLHAWTFGYEDVWIALSSALRSQVDLLLDYPTGLRAYVRLDSRRRIQILFLAVAGDDCQN